MEEPEPSCSKKLSDEKISVKSDDLPGKSSSLDLSREKEVNGQVHFIKPLLLQDETSSFAEDYKEMKSVPIIGGNSKETLNKMSKEDQKEKIKNVEPLKGNSGENFKENQKENVNFDEN